MMSKAYSPVTFREAQTGYLQLGSLSDQVRPSYPNLRNLAAQHLEQLVFVGRCYACLPALSRGPTAVYVLVQARTCSCLNAGLPCRLAAGSPPDCSPDALLNHASPHHLGPLDYSCPAGDR